MSVIRRPAVIVLSDSAADLGRRIAALVDGELQFAGEILGVNHGEGIEIGDQADLILIDPAALQQFDHHDSARRIFRDEFQHDQLVNRTDGVVPLVMIKGHPAWSGDHFEQGFGKQQFGRVLETVF